MKRFEAPAAVVEAIEQHGGQRPVVRVEEGALVGIWTTPGTVLLSRGITLEAGTPEPLVIPYQACDNGRCQAVATLGGDFVDTLAALEEASLAFFAEIVLQSFAVTRQI